MRNICVYGSLRKGCYNFDRFCGYYPGEIIYKETTTIDANYALFSLGSYPALVKSEEKNNITVDILEVSERAFEALNRMEVGAGYSPVKININGVECTVWIYNYKAHPNAKVESGNWVEYLASKELVY